MISSHTAVPGSFDCDECGATYLKHGVLINHMRKKHGIESPDMRFKCSKCPKVFDTIKKLNRHMKSNCSAK